MRLRLLLLYPPKLTSDSVVELRGLRAVCAAALLALLHFLLQLALLLLLLLEGCVEEIEGAKAPLF